MEQTKYRVEAFIIPVGNERYVESTTDSVRQGRIEEGLKISNHTDVFTPSENVTASFVKDKVENSFPTKEESIQNLQNFIILGSVADVNHIASRNTKDSAFSTLRLDSELSENKLVLRAETGTYYASDSTKKEGHEKAAEGYDKHEKNFTDLCYHGCKNGCSAIVPTPQEVSEDVFKENWLQKLESIKQKEATLKNKEMILQSRERALFKRERELRYMERILSDKIKQVNVCLRRDKRSQGWLEVNTFLEEPSGSVSCHTEELHEQKFNVYEDLPENTCGPNDFKSELFTRFKKGGPYLGKDSQEVGANEKTAVVRRQQEKSSACESSCSSNSNTSEDSRSKHRPSFKSSTISKSSSSKCTGSSSNKAKRQCKVYYEDLDTTLSADIGDSSFVQTSQKFNPNLYKKPYAFTRSASERHIKRANTRVEELQSLATVKEEIPCPVGIEQHKVLRRVTENISASQDKNTKFQDYGLIDQNIDTANKTRGPDVDAKEEERYSYLNLEIGEKYSLRHKISNWSKERPTSWNEGTNEWLQKKRHTYRTTNTRLPREDTENKENFKCNSKVDKSTKVSKKNDIKTKIFTIFR